MIVMRFISGFRFRLRLIPFLATLVTATIGVALGQWQLRRADQKQAIEVKLVQRAAAPSMGVESIGSDATAAEYRRVTLRGEFVWLWPLYLDNRPHRNHAGLYVLMPFRVVGSGQVVMVERGWIARDSHDRTHLPPLYTPTGTVTIEGRLRTAPGHVMQLGQVARVQRGAILQNLNLGEMARVSGLPMESFLIEQTSALPDGLVREWPQPSAGIERHYGYAFQWFALAVVTCVFFVVTGFRRDQSSND
ncbi:MAG: SURF1 family protein [Burkholderiaceae bacterium]